MARSNLSFRRSGLWRASTRAWFSGSAWAASESYLLDSMALVHRAQLFIARYPTWIATTTSHPSRSLACFAQGPVERGAMGPFRPGATSSWTGAARSLACSRLPPAPRVRVATPITLRDIRPLPRPIPGHRARCSRPFVAGEPRHRRQALVSRVKCKGSLAGSVARWPLGG